jgi:hypothetical protein
VYHEHWGTGAEFSTNSRRRNNKSPTKKKTLIKIKK